MTDTSQSPRASTQLFPGWAQQIVKEAIDEADAEFHDPELALRKQGFDITIDPASLIGALAGYAVAKRMAGKQLDAQPAHATPKLSGDYYAQMDTLLKHMRVTFTPIGAIYVVRSGNRDIGIETLETSAMSPEMRRAWVARDERFFLNMKLNQMQADLHLAEQLFAQRLLQRHRLLKTNADKLANLDQAAVQGLLKQAEEAAAPESAEDQMIPLDEIHAGIAELRRLAERAHTSHALEKYCDLLFQGALEDSIRVIPGGGGWRRDPSIEKTAALITSPLKFFGLGRGEYLNPAELRNKLKVAFLPDRVLYVYDQMVVGQTHVSQLNEDGYRHFRRQDLPYFRKFISQELADGHALMQVGAPEGPVVVKTATDQSFEQLPIAEPITADYPDPDQFEPDDAEDDELDRDEADRDAGVYVYVDQGNHSNAPAMEEKRAASSAGEELWMRDDIHPFVYYMAMTKRYGRSWMSWDPAVLIKIVETDFAVAPIGDIALNKVLHLQLLNTNSTLLENYHLFEKLVRSFNNRDIDFMERQPVISLAEIANTLMVVAENSGVENPYAALSDDVRHYLTEVLVDGGYYAVYPPSLAQQDDSSLWDDLNERIVELRSDIAGADLNDGARKPIATRLSKIQAECRSVVLALRAKGLIPSAGQVSALVKRAGAKNGATIDDDVAEQVTQAVMKNIAVDHYMQHLRTRIGEQMLRYAP